MPNISLSTFAKMSQSTPEQKIAEYRRYLTPGGFDYYRELRDAIAILTWKGGEASEAHGHLASIKNTRRRKHCSSALEHFSKLILQEGRNFIEPPQVEIVSPGGFLRVNVRPWAVSTLKCITEF